MTGPGSDRGGLLDDRPRGQTAPVGSAGGRRTDGRIGRAGRRRRRGDPNAVVPEAEFTSYYGRPVVKPSPWSEDIPAYLFLGGLAAGSSLLASGAARTGRPALRRHGRITALLAVSGSFAALVHDLGRPGRFLNMLRVAKPTSPMSMGTWLLTGYAPLAGLAAGAEVAALAPRAGLGWRVLRTAGTPAGAVASLLAPAVATYTAVLLSDTATPAWYGGRREMPFLFAGSSASAAGGLALLTVPIAQVGPARRLAIAGAASELIAQQAMERSLGLAAEPLSQGKAARWRQLARAGSAGGAMLALLGRRSRTVSALAGVALVAGSVGTRFAIFEAGQQSARDPKYTVIPQRERLDRQAEPG